METARRYWYGARVVFVSPGLGGDTFGPFTRKLSGSLSRIVSKRLPMRPTQAEAQADLDAFAARNNLPEASL